jgi:ATP-dependent DNA ligase
MQTQITFLKWFPLFALLVFSSCENQQDAWKEDLKASKEYAELNSLRMEESIGLNNRIDKLAVELIKGKSNEESKAIIRQVAEELRNSQQELKRTPIPESTLYSSSAEAEEAAQEISIAYFENSSLSEPVKKMFIEDIKAQSKAQIRRAKLEQDLLTKFPQLNGSLGELLKVMQEGKQLSSN